MDFQTYTQSVRQPLTNEIYHALSQWKKETLNASPILKDETSSFILAQQPGKGIRGTLVLLGFELTGAKIHPDIFKPAAAVEIVHTSLLIHDDIIDQSPTRRGLASVYHQLGANHYGTSQAICLGDAGFFLGWKLLAECNVADKEKKQMLTVFTHIISDTITGEMLDISLANSQAPSKEHDIITMYRLKTAYYTIVMPLMLGAILGKGSEKLFTHIKHFGENAGIAFQIYDDISGIFGDEKKIGKSTTSDITEGKNTILRSYIEQNGEPSHKRIFSRYYGKKKITEYQLKKVKTVLEESGARTYSEQQAKNYLQKAEALIPELTDNTKHQKILASFLNALCPAPI